MLKCQLYIYLDERLQWRFVSKSCYLPNSEVSQVFRVFVSKQLYFKLKIFKIVSGNGSQKLSEKDRINIELLEALKSDKMLWSFTEGAPFEVTEIFYVFTIFSIREVLTNQFQFCFLFYVSYTILDKIKEEKST